MMAEGKAPEGDGIRPDGFVEVAQGDAEYRYAGRARMATFDREQESQALRSFFEDPEISATCAAVLGPRWQTVCQSKWELWSKAPAGVLGAAVEKVVVTDLDAAHLQPSDIRRRLEGGTSAACFGVATVMQNLPDAISQPEAKAAPS